MTLDPHHQRPQRRSIRLPDYDYSGEGDYFITITTHQMQRLFGEIFDGEMTLNAFGKIVMEEWLKSSSIREEIQLDADEFIVMPNHIHGIVHIVHKDATVRAYGYTPVPNGYTPVPNGYTPVPNGHTPVPGGQTDDYAYNQDSSKFRSPSRTLGAMIRGFKLAVTTRINMLRQSSGQPVWHRNYYEHIITSDEEYANIFNYIRFNPQTWSERDEHNFHL